MSLFTRVSEALCQAGIGARDHRCISSYFTILEWPTPSQCVKGYGLRKRSQVDHLWSKREIDGPTGLDGNQGKRAILRTGSQDQTPVLLLIHCVTLSNSLPFRYFINKIGKGRGQDDLSDVYKFAFLPQDLCTCYSPQSGNVIFYLASSYSHFQSQCKCHLHQKAFSEPPN